VNKRHILIAICVVAVGTLVWGLFPGNTYGFFLILRVIVCAASAYAAYLAYRAKREGWVWLLGGCAALYNPFIRVQLTRETWWVVNVVTIALLMSACYVLSRTPRVAK